MPLKCIAPLRGWGLNQIIMNTSNNELLNRMSLIKDETQDNQNTATKIGQMLIDFLDSTIIKGKDKSQNPSNSQPNLWFLTQSDRFKMVMDLIVSGYLKRNRLYLTENGTIELSSNLEKLNAPATTQGELQEKRSITTITPDQNKNYTVSMRVVEGGLQKNTCETSIGTSEESYFEVDIFHGYSYNPATFEYSVIEKYSNFKVLADALVFLISGQPCINVNPEGIFQNPSFVPQFAQAGWVAPYQHVKNRVIRLPYATLPTLDCAFYNSTMFHLDFIVGGDPNKVLIENLADGAEIIVFFKLRVDGGALGFLGGFYSYFNIPNLTNLTANNELDGGIISSATVQRTFKLNGKCLYNYPSTGKNAILWEVFEFPNPIV